MMLRPRSMTDRSSNWPKSSPSCHRLDLTYILTAAPRTELRPYTWWFLIVGRVPYKGYFSKEDAAAAAKELESEGYDTNIRTSAAFSTLGWFDDPLLAHLLRYDKV